MSSWCPPKRINVMYILSSSFWTLVWVKTVWVLMDAKIIQGGKLLVTSPTSINEFLLVGLGVIYELVHVLEDLITGFHNAFIDLWINVREPITKEWQLDVQRNGSDIQQQIPMNKHDREIKGLKRERGLGKWWHRNKTTEIPWSMVIVREHGTSFFPEITLDIWVAVDTHSGVEQAIDLWLSLSGLFDR